MAVLVVSSALSAATPCSAAEAVPGGEVLDLDQAAALLQVEPGIVRALAETQRIPARRVGDAWRFSRAALLEWVKGEQAAGMPNLPPATTAVDRSEASARDPLALTARGVPASPMLLAQAAPSPKPDPGQAPPTVGERPATPTAEEIALRDQRVLLKRGAATIDFGVAYTYSEQTPLPGIRVEQRNVVANAAVRYGLLDGLQITLRAPYLWRRNSTYADASISGTTSPSVTRDDYAADVSVSLLGVAMHEAAGRPNMILSLDYVAPTGPGDRGVGVGVVLSKSYDPAVIFAGLSYLKGLDTDAADAQRSLASNSFGMNLGYTYAINDSLALSTVFIGTYRDAASPDGVSIPPPRERYLMQFGMTWRVARSFFAEPAVAMRLGGETADVALSVNFTYSF